MTPLWRVVHYRSMPTLSVKIKLNPNADQKSALLKTFATFNTAASLAAEAGFNSKTFNRFGIHKLSYRDIRDKTGLTSQLVVLAIGKAANCFTTNKRVCPKFKKYSAISFDRRVMSFYGSLVSLGTVAGRLKIPLVIDARARSLLGKFSAVKQVDLQYVQGEFYLCCPVLVPDQPVHEYNNFLGVDLGVSQLAVDSLGNMYSGAGVLTKQRWFAGRRHVLQQVGTRSAKRRLRALSRSEANYRRTENHKISRRIVDTAKAQNLGISVEDLTGIRGGKRFRKSQRAQIHGWAFSQLTFFIAYKAKLAGIPFKKVDPRHTSVTCNSCGSRDKRNRLSQSVFSCTICGNLENADLNAAKNISKKASVNLAMVADVDGETVYPA